MSAALNGDSLSRNIVASPFVFCRCLHSPEHAASRMWRRIAGASLQTRNVLAFLQDVFHVRWAGAHVFRGEVFSCQTVHHAAMRTEKLLAVHSFVMAHYDGLATAKR